MNNIKDKSKNKSINISEEEDKIINYKQNHEKEDEIDQISEIYSDLSDQDEDYEIGSKIKLVEPEKNEDGYGINLTSVNNNEEIRRRVRTEYTKHEIDKLFEFKKNNILIQNGRIVKKQTQESGNQANDDDNFLRVSTCQNKKSKNRKSHNSFSRSNTMISNRSQSINKNKYNPLDKRNLLKFNPDKIKFSKPEENPKSKSIIKSKRNSRGTSIEKSPLNTSIIKDMSREPSNQNESTVREKSISDPVQEFKIKYKSDNVLNQLGRRNDEGEGLNQTISINDFEVVKELGKGKFGKVLMVRRKINGDEFAVKLIPIKNSLDKYNEANLNSESEIFKTISHRYVVKAYYCLIYESMLCFFMEFLSGGSLSDLFEKNFKEMKSFSYKDITIYSAHIVKGLQYLHSKNIIHRDLKPDNILVDAEGFLKITDFGLSRIVNEVEKKAEGGTYNLNEDSMEDQIVGTPDYMALELIEETKVISSGVDWWSLGCILYQLIWGYPPFNDKTVNRVFSNIRTMKIDWPFEDKEKNKTRYEFVMGLLHPNPRKRLGFNGPEEVMRHPFFAEIDWHNLDKTQSSYMKELFSKAKQSQNLSQKGPNSNSKNKSHVFKFPSNKSSRSRQSSKRTRDQNIELEVDLIKYLENEMEHLEPLEEPITEMAKKNQLPMLKPFYKKDHLKNLNRLAFEKQLNKIRITDKDMNEVFKMVNAKNFIVNFFINYDFIFDFKLS